MSFTLHHENECCFVESEITITLLLLLLLLKRLALERKKCTVAAMWGY